MPMMAAERANDNYHFFYGGIFSQWAPAPFVTTIPDFGHFAANERYQFANAEQFMMACKAAFFGDLPSFEAIVRTTNPSVCKALGKKVKNFEVKAWAEISRELVFQGNLAKFRQNPKMKEYLLGTGYKVLVEGSPYDEIWGVKLSYDDPRILDPANWKGLNWLGKVLMAVREYIRMIDG